MSKKRCVHVWTFWDDPVHRLAPWFCERCGAWEERPDVDWPESTAVDNVFYIRPRGSFPIRLVR